MFQRENHTGVGPMHWCSIRRAIYLTHTHIHTRTHRHTDITAGSEDHFEKRTLDFTLSFPFTLKKVAGVATTVSKKTKSTDRLCRAEHKGRIILPT